MSLEESQAADSTTVMIRQTEKDYSESIKMCKEW